MSERPQRVRADEQGDLLEQIIARGLDKMEASSRMTAGPKAPPEEAPAAPAPEGGGGSAATADRRHRRSAVYLYLLVMFGAAFLMLLLAYFVQRRSSEDAISNLRDSMNLSRQELLDQIGALEEKNTSLTEDNEALSEWNKQLSGELAQWQERYEEQVQEANDLQYQIDDAWDELYSWQSFWELEQYYQARDYESCAAVIILQRQSQYTYRAPDPARQEEITQAVIDAGVLDRDMPVSEGYNDLLDAYFSSKGYYEMLSHSSAGRANVSRETEG